MQYNAGISELNIKNDGCDIILCKCQNSWRLLRSQ